jgi:tetratricopeptide (TPR) repeat protein
VEGADRTREDLLKGKTFADEALTAHRALGNRFDLAWDLHTAGMVALKLGELEEADRHWREALRVFTDANDASGIVILLSDFAELAHERGDEDRRFTLVGAWTALSQRTGVGLPSLWGTTEGRTTDADLTPERQAAFDRGAAMKTEDATAYVLASAYAKTV